MNEIKSVFEQLDKVATEVNVDAVFGAPREFKGCVLIPVAELTYGLAAGAGTPPTPPAGQPEETPGEEQEPVVSGAPTVEAVGAGGASGAHARPIAIIEVKPDGAHIRPIENETLIAFMGILLVGWTVGWAGLVLKTLFGRRR